MEWFVYIALVVVVIAMRLSLRAATGGLRWSGEANVEEQHARALARRARSIPWRSVADAPEATVVRLAGEVKVHEDALTAPITGARCAYWLVVVYQHRGVGVSQSWEQLAQHSDHTSFVLADSSGEMLVDPASATVSVCARKTKIINPGEAVPEKVAALLVERDWSIEDIRRRDRPIRVDEMALVFGTNVAVIGAGTSVARGERKERDYRSTAPTWLALSGGGAELLISDARPLLRRSLGIAGAAEEWARSGGAAERPVDASGGDVDEFEGKLRRRARLVRAVLIAVLVIAAVRIAFALGLSRLWTKAPPEKQLVPMLSEQQRATLRDEIDRRRVATYRADDEWRLALQTREQVTGASPDACAQTAVLDKHLPRSFKNSFSVAEPDAPFPLVAIEAGEALPVASPRTKALVAVLDTLERSISTARADEYETLRPRVMAPPDTTVDVLVELAREGERVRVRAWLYDHQLRRIVCAGESRLAAAELNPQTAGFASGALDSLRAVRSAAVVHP